MHYDSRTQYQNSNPTYAKALSRELLKEQEKGLLKILSLNKLKLQVTDNNNKLKEICKETDYWKLSLDASLNTYQDKLLNFKKL